MTTLKAIIFDMDDTLYPESMYVMSGFRAVATWLAKEHEKSADQYFATLKTLFEKGIRGNTFNIWLEQLKITPDAELIQECVTVYREHTPNIKPFNEVVPMLKQIQPNFKIGLLSDGYLRVQQLKFEALDISHYFDSVVFSDEFGHDAWKPSTIPYVEVLKRLNETATSAVYIGDNIIKDFFGAKRLGIQTIWVKRASGEYINSRMPSDSHRPDYIVENLSEIPDIVNQR